MEDFNASNLVGFAAAIALAAAIPALVPKLPLPGVVLEIAFGVILGPQILGIIGPTPAGQLFSILGIAFLFFIAGFDIDPTELRGRPIRNALAGWVVSAAIAFGAAWLLAMRGVASAPLFVGLAMTTTAIGALYPVLRDAKLLSPPYGPIVLSAGAVGEALPIVVLSFVLAGHGQTVKEAVILAGYAVAIVATVLLISRWKHGVLAAVVHRTIGTSGQFPLRAAVCVLILMVVLSRELNVDPVLGAFAAGAIVRAALSEDHRHVLSARLDGLGYGFFVPIFFILSGVHLDVTGLLSDPIALMMVPVFCILMLIARGLPALLFYGADLSFRQRLALALHSGTQLPVVVAIVGIALHRGLMPGHEGAALVGAGMLTMLLFPAIAYRLLRREAVAMAS